MYLEFFQLKELPFRITPDKGYYFNNTGHREAMNVLKVALNADEGFIKITGEVGTGKTLLCRKVSELVGDTAVVAYIHNPYLTPETLKMALAEELELRFPRDISQHHLLKLITERLEELHSYGKRVIVCVDEAQALPLESIEALRLLTNLETEKHKLLQVVLFGQPELDVKLGHESIRQLKQRIAFSYQLRPMARECVRDYINYRLTVAGHNGAPLFSHGAITLLHRYSHGVPRLVNILSHKAMMVAYGKGHRRIDTQHVRAAIADTESVQEKPLGRLGRFLYSRLGLTG